MYLITMIFRHYGKIIKSNRPPFKIIFFYFYLAEVAKYSFSMIPFGSMTLQSYEFTVRRTTLSVP